MKSEKKSTFLKGLKRVNPKRSENRVAARTMEGRRSDKPNSTKVGQGSCYVDRDFDVQKKRAEQANGGENTKKRSKFYESRKPKVKL